MARCFKFEPQLHGTTSCDTGFFLFLGERVRDPSRHQLSSTELCVGIPIRCWAWSSSWQQTHIQGSLSLLDYLYVDHLQGSTDHVENCKPFFTVAQDAVWSGKALNKISCDSLAIFPSIKCKKMARKSLEFNPVFWNFFKNLNSKRHWKFKELRPASNIQWKAFKYPVQPFSKLWNRYLKCYYAKMLNMLMLMIS